MSVGEGCRVRFESVRSDPYGCGWEPITLDGVLEAVQVRPWGTDATVRLEPPVVVGHLTYLEPVERVSVSVSRLEPVRVEGAT